MYVEQHIGSQNTQKIKKNKYNLKIKKQTNKNEKQKNFANPIY